MNYAIIRNILGKLMILLAGLMVLPLIVSVIYQEGLQNYLAFIIPIGLLLIFGLLFNIKKPRNTNIVAREGLIIAGLSWLLLSLFGCIPFMISGEIPNFFDAFFEIVSGFTTTGASVVTDVTALSHSILFWRSFSHWIGGMGVLVFILAIIPESKDGSSMHILRAESPGPQVGKLVSKMRVTSRILYLIYVVLTIIQFLFLWLGPDEQMTAFNSIIYTLGTAGTGGFSMDPQSLEFYAPYSQYVIAIFMLIFGVNFSLYYLILIGNIKEVLKNEELKWYLAIVAIAVALLCINTFQIYDNIEETFRHALFQVASIISTTGYSSTGYSTYEVVDGMIKVGGWPVFSQVLVFILMFFGACAGSTAGGLKITRINVLVKSMIKKIKNVVNPRKVEVLCIDKKPADNKIVEVIQNFFVLYMMIFLICSLIISLDGNDFVTNITASLSCISNVGPGLNAVGPYGSYSVFSSFSKFILSLEMIAGRLELFPLLVLFSPKTWARHN